MFDLRPYQQTDIDAVQNLFRQHRSVLYRAATGSGKTAVGSHAVLGAVKRGRRVVFIAHRQEIIQQTGAKFDALGIGYDYLVSGLTVSDHMIQIASMQTLSRRLGWITWTPDFVVVDECHHAESNQYKRILSHWPNAYILGLTATPCRTDGVGLGSTFQAIYCGPSEAELIGLGYLSPVECYAPPRKVNLSHISIVAGDYNEAELATEMDRPEVTGDAIEHYRTMGEGMPCLTFCVTVKHADGVAEQYRSAGFRAESVNGGTPREKRRAVIDALGSGGLDILTSCDIIGEGTDIPVVGVVQMLRPTQSLIVYLQQVGRGMRPYPGKRAAILLDHVGNSARHGHPLDFREWTLEGRKRRISKIDPDISIRQCERCYFVWPAGVVSCPKCGWRPDPRKLAAVVAGKLEKVEVSPEKKKELRMEVGSARSIEVLKAIAKERGYKPGWVWMRAKILRERGLL